MHLQCEMQCNISFLVKCMYWFIFASISRNFTLASMDENHLAHMVAAAIFVLLQSNYFININIKQTEEQNIVLLTVLRDLCQQYQNSNGTGNTSSSRRRMEKEIKDSTWKSDHKLIFQLLPRNYTRTQMRT